MKNIINSLIIILTICFIVGCNRNNEVNDIDKVVNSVKIIGHKSLIIFMTPS